MAVNFRLSGMIPASCYSIPQDDPLEKKKKSAKRQSRQAELPTSAAPQLLNSCLIAGIGASAGGLEAVSALIQSLPADTGIAFVLVQHLDPRHPSALVDILSKSTRMPVREAQAAAAVQPNAIYVIPPGADLTIQRGKLQLQRRPETRTPHRPIDVFFQSLGVDARDRSIGVIL
jgi:two-component system CheB/CheR fusion protein